MTSGPFGNRWLALLLALVAAGTGCTERPRAPALEDSPVYQNNHEGFRFLVPEGWFQQLNSAVPPGRLDSDLVLVRYCRHSTSGRSTLQVSAQDLPEEADLARVLTEARSEGTAWKLAGPPAEARVGNRAGRRLVFTGKGPSSRLEREVFAVRKGQRVYFFSVSFVPGDHVSRDLVRQAFAKVVWTR
jgi:hypothetical protein